MISLYSPPDPILLAQSNGTLFSCTYQATLTVIDAVDISQVVAMIPHTVNGQQHYFMFEQPGQDVTNLGGFMMTAMRMTTATAISSFHYVLL